MIARGEDRPTTFTSAEIQGVHLLSVSGQVDGAAQAEFRAALERAVAGASSPLVIDLSGVAYMGSHCIGALIQAQKQMTARPDKLYIVPGTSRMRRTFAVLGLEKFFDMYLSADDALEAALKSVA